VTAQELLAKQPELSAQLKKVGPVAFIRELILKLGGAALTSQGNAKLTPAKLATLFLYEDTNGQKLKVSVVNELTPTGQNHYELLVEPSDE
jgi:hypothetical protein